MAGRVEGKVAFITGAARGQGRSHAVKLASEGADIIAIDICRQIESVPYPMSTPEDLKETVALVEATGRKIISAEVDVRDYDAMKAVVDQGVEQFGRLDIVSANAGIGSQGAPLQNMGEDGWTETVDVLLNGVWRTVKAATQPMIDAGNGGSMILTTSVGGLKALPTVGGYVAAKHGVIGLMKTAAVELAEHSIRVNCVAPTQVNTPMVMNEMTFKMFRPDLENPTAEDFAPISQMFHLLPTPYVEAEDISNALLFLASDESRYITGSTIAVDAGSLLK